MYIYILIHFYQINNRGSQNDGSRGELFRLGAVQVSRDQDGGRGGVCQMITLDHRGEGGCQPNDHMITHQGGGVPGFQLCILLRTQHNLFKVFQCVKGSI